MSKIKQAVVVIFFVILAIFIAYGFFAVVMYSPPYYTRSPRMIIHEVEPLERPYYVEVYIKLDDGSHHHFDNVRSVDIITKGTLRVATKEIRQIYSEYETFNITKVRFRFKKDGYLVEFTDLLGRDYFVSTNDAYLYPYETPVFMRITDSAGYSTKTFYNVEDFDFHVLD
ncbi:MAG: hypothetical protein N2V75_06955 [Methanophagales archaeon]|nr:hypothetical protein [Methanophagales archaeon]